MYGGLQGPSIEYDENFLGVEPALDSNKVIHPRTGMISVTFQVYEVITPIRLNSIQVHEFLYVPTSLGRQVFICPA